MGLWFSSDFTGRELRDDERQFLNVLESMLKEVAPAQVDPADSRLTAEGANCLIVLVPHRSLAGLSIVVWFEPRRISISWALVGTLARRHDDLDLGVWVARFQAGGESTERWYQTAVEGVRAELSRSIEVTVSRRLPVSGERQVEFRLQIDGRRKTLGSVGRREPRRFFFIRRAPKTTADIYTVRFTDNKPPPVFFGSNVENWFGPQSHT